MRWQGLLLAIYWLFCSAVVTVAQNSTSSLRGDVADSSGAAVVAPQVALKNPATGFSTSCATDSRGEYRFLRFPAGTYTVSVAAQGFTAQFAVVELLVNQPATQTFSLSVEALQTVVQVNSEAQGLNFVDASMGDAVNDATIQSLPMEGRNVPDLLSLQPECCTLAKRTTRVMTAAAELPVAAAPTRATSRWMEWTTTIRRVAMLSPECSAPLSIQFRNFA